MLDKSANGLTRRGFMGSTAAAGLGAMFGQSILGAGAAQAATSGEVLTGTHFGAFYATVTDGKITGVRGWEQDPRPSPMLEGVIDQVYSPSRIKYPMVRRAWLEGGPGSSPETRGQGDFVRVSWDEALDLVAGEIKRMQETYGPTSIFAGSYGWKSVGKVVNSRTLLRRCMNGAGGFTSHAGDYSTAASQVIMPHVMGTLEVYEQQTAWPVVVESTDILVIWGADPMVTNQCGWVIPDHGGYTGMEDFKATGKRVICIDPVHTETAKFFDAEWIAPKPQTDVAMMLGMAHTLYAEDLHDQEFLDSNTSGFEKFLPYLTGESDGQPKDAEWAADICGIDAEVIKQLARDFAANRTMLASGWSMQRMHHGEQAHWMLVTLASMLGQIGLPGGGFGLSYHYSNGGTPSASGPRVAGITDGGVQVARGAASAYSEASASIPVARIVECLENPGGAFDFNGKEGVYPDIKMVYWAGGNPFHHHQDRNRQIEAFKKVETFVVNEIQWTASARHADIVLPVTTVMEHDDIEAYGDYSGKGVIAMRKVIEPMYEARSDFEVFQAISERLGTREYFDEGKDAMDWIKQFYEDAIGQGSAFGVDMPDFETFWEQGYVLYDTPEEAKSWVRHADFRDDPLLEPLGTPTGLIEIYSNNIEKMGYDDCGPHPMWMEPVERLDGPDAKFPLHVATSHPNGRLHSQLCGTSFRKTYTVADHEPCLINPEDAAARGIADGDVVRVFNDRGQILAGAVVTDSVRNGVIRVNEGGWYNPVTGPDGKPMCAYGDINNLSLDIPTSKLGQGNCGHTIIADVEKFEGEVPPITVFDAPTEG